MNKSPNALPLKQLMLCALFAASMRADFISAIKEHPGEGKASAFSKGTDLLSAGKVDDAEKAFRESVRLQPSQGIGYVGLAAVEFNRRKMKEAEAHLQQALKIEPKDLGISEAWGRFLFEAGRFKEAEPVLRKVAAQRPGDGPLHIALADTLHRLGRDKEAAATYRDALKSSPDHGGGHFGLGMALQAQKMWKEAEAEFQKASNLAPKNPLPPQALGELMLIRNDDDRALQHFELALYRDSKFVPAYLSRGDVRMKRRDFARASADYQEAGKLSPRAALPRMKAGMCAQAQGRLTEATKLYQEAVTLEPTLAAGYNNLAAITAESKGDLPKGMEWAKKAVGLAPTNPAFLDTLGWLQHLSGNSQNAVLTLRKATAGTAPDPTALYHLGVASQAAGNTAEAKSTLKRAFEINPAFPESADAKKRLAALPR